MRARNAPFGLRPTEMSFSRERQDIAAELPCRPLSAMRTGHTQADPARAGPAFWRASWPVPGRAPPKHGDERRI